MTSAEAGKDGNNSSERTTGLPMPEILSHSAGFLLNRAGRIMRTRASESLQPFGLTLQELGVMRILEDQGSLSQQHLCAAHHIDRTTMVKLIDSLEERELVYRGTNPSDRRSYQVSLTPKGHKTLRQAARRVKKVQDEFLAPLSDGEWQSMRQSLLKLITHHKEDTI